MVERIRKQVYPGIIHVNPWYANDHYTFYPHGVLRIAFGWSGGIMKHTSAGRPIPVDQPSEIG